MSVSGLPTRRPLLVAAGIVCLVTGAAYATTVGDYFLNDDFGVVALLSDKPATYFPRWFVSSWMDTIWGYHPDEIRPFPALSYQLTAWPDATSPVAHHLLNVIIHAANGLLVLALAHVVVGLRVWPATVAALLFVLLPVQSESVAWITGRVDSLPALFYLASLLAYALWRRSATGMRLYVVSLVLGVMALFSKQNAITLAPALLAYDLLIERRRPRPVWSWLWPYLPFTAATAGYLSLRYALFGQVVRESLLTADGLAYAAAVIERHTWRTIFGHAVAPSPAEVTVTGMAFALVAWCATRPGGSSRLGGSWRAALYFVPVWWLLGIAPVLVAGYESPRHVYLAAVAWAMAVGLACQWLSDAVHSRTARAIVVLLVTALLGWYAVQLSGSVRDWNRRALVSWHATRDVEREALAAPAGTLLIVGASPGSWEWALPFAARPPFTSTDVTARVRIVSPRVLHCCRDQWDADTRRTLAAWLADGDAPVVALRWSESTGRLLRTDDRAAPDLRSIASYLARVPSGDDLDRILSDALIKLLPSR